jgi:hypothetical protein
VEWYWQEKLKNSGKKLVPVPLCLPQSHMDWPGRKAGLPRWEAGD